MAKTRKQELGDEVTTVAFAVLRHVVDGRTLYLPAKVAIVRGIVEGVIPIRDEGAVVYESIAYEHASAAVMEHYAQKQIDEARQVRP